MTTESTSADALWRKDVLLVLEGMIEDLEKRPAPQSAEAFGIQKGARMAIGTAMDRLKAIPGTDESPTFMGDPVIAKPLDRHYGAPDWDPTGIAEALIARSAATVGAAPEPWRSMESAPTDGTIVRLLVDYSGDDACHPLEDAQIAPTIGGNTDGNTGESEGWKFAGWSWEQDCFTEGAGKPVGWLPFAATPAAPKAAPQTAPQEAEGRPIGTVTRTEVFAAMQRCHLRLESQYAQLDMRNALEGFIADRAASPAAAPQPANPLYISGPYPDGSYSICEMSTLRVLQKLSVGDFPEQLRAPQPATCDGGQCGIGDLLPAVRNVLIENPPQLASPTLGVKDEN